MLRVLLIGAAERRNRTPHNGEGENMRRIDPRNPRAHGRELRGRPWRIRAGQVIAIAIVWAAILGVVGLGSWLESCAAVTP